MNASSRHDVPPLHERTGPADNDAGKNSPEIADLIIRAVAGERDAFREIVRIYHPKVYRWA